MWKGTLWFYGAKIIEIHSWQPLWAWALKFRLPEYGVWQMKRKFNTYFLAPAGVRKEKKANHTQKTKQENIPEWGFHESIRWQNDRSSVTGKPIHALSVLNHNRTDHHTKLMDYWCVAIVASYYCMTSSFCRGNLTLIFYLKFFNNLLNRDTPLSVRWVHKEKAAFPTGILKIIFFI